ncbi:MAG: glutamate--tRNA ligase [Phycisphaerales bacterium]
MTPTIVTRFAPSPTGALHVGGARTALYNWAFAKHHGGKFLLRLEDTDQQRSSDAAADAMLKDLAWIGLDWDNAGAVPKQSERLHLYNAAIKKLLSAGKAYEDNGAIRFKIPNESISFHDEVRGDVTIPAGQTEDFVIRKTDGFPTYHLAVVIDDADMGVTHVLRAQEHLSNTPKHILLQNALGLPHPTYAHFGLILNPDGSKMSKRDKAKAARKGAENWCRLTNRAITELTDLVVAELKHFDQIYKKHVGVSSDSLDHTMERVRSFFEKRNDDMDIAVASTLLTSINLPEIEVADFRNSGYLPQVLCNYLALLGWNPGDDLEKFDNTFLAANFSLDRVNKGDSKFDREKLFRFNADALAAMSPEDFRQLLWDFYGAYANHFSSVNDESFVLFCHAYQPRARTLAEPGEIGSFFLNQPHRYDAQAVIKVLKKNDGEGLKVLAQLQGMLNNIADWNEHSIESAVKLFAESNNLGLGKVAQPIRVAVSGSTVSPGIGQTLTILGKQETLHRIANCLELCKT